MNTLINGIKVHKRFKKGGSFKDVIRRRTEGKPRWGGCDPLLRKDQKQWQLFTLTPKCFFF